MPIKARCRHDNSSWIMFDGLLLWCYRCGAIRSMKHTGLTSIDAHGPWLKPVGPDGDNPWSKYNAARERWRERNADQG